jgi:hypothetical protein
MKRYLKTAARVAALAGVLALASFLTTFMLWDGGFPSGTFRVSVRDSDGMPVKGAILRVYHGGTRDLALKYPLDNHLANHELISDENGRITAIRKDGGLQFGGHAWFLFWVIPMGAKAPQYDCEITAEGFKPLQFRIQRLFESPRGFSENVCKSQTTIENEEIPLPIYEHVFALER